ncbi:lecithin retinol acyltransferase a [Engraulis encrasicolus]|uniref:lecithin retinol acyltransferase a n=1 Tax=Engraulis encrasicolus TaxID=184585 RepID=UPI002FD71CD1
MLDSLTLVFEKLFVLSNFNLFKNLWLEEEEETCNTSTTLKRGDLLEVQRTLFTHFGIYLGDNKVAHLMPDIMPLLTVNEKKINAVVTNKRLVLGCIYKKASIRVDTVGDFAYGARIFVNSVDGRMKTKALAQEDVAQRAEKMVGDIPYSLLWYNCEHFATYCRYDSPVSEQTDQFCETLKTVVRDQRSVLLTISLGILSIACFGLAPSTTLPTVLIPFALWMAG